MGYPFFYDFDYSIIIGVGIISITSSILQSRYWQILSTVSRDTYSPLVILASVELENPTASLSWVFVISLSNNNLNNGL